MINAFNRDQGEVQNIKRVFHPQKLFEQVSPQEQHRRLKKQPVALQDVAEYCSAYEVSDALIGNFEATVIRAFANDLMKVRKSF